MGALYMKALHIPQTTKQVYEWYYYLGMQRLTGRYTKIIAFQTGNQGGEWRSLLLNKVKLRPKIKNNLLRVLHQ